ncbi:MAG TPA: DUF6049 family protein, partial [Actinomycetota bacterium]|nr:DUF6049 family protein [Actinomycetota bacterium]
MHADRPPHPLPKVSARAHNRIARGALAAALLLGALVAPPPPATAQESEEETSGYTLDLLAQPVWHTGEDDLGIRVRVTNDTSQPLEGFRIRVGVNERVTTRSDLHDRFDVDPGLEPSSIPIDRSETIPAFDSVTVDLDESLASFTTIANSSGGIHPTTLTLQDLQGVEPNLASVTTPLIYYPQVPETPLDLALLLPINAPPARAPDGTFPATDGSLDDLYGGRSWLTGMLSAVQEATTPIERPEPPRRRRGSKKNRRRPQPPPPPPPVHLSLAATPRLIEELA